SRGDRGGAHRRWQGPPAGARHHHLPCFRDSDERIAASLPAHCAHVGRRWISGCLLWLNFHCSGSGQQEAPQMTNPDMTIRDISVTMLRLPWADDPWLKGHALGQTRDILICDVETAGGITGMGYLFLFRPGMKSIAACLEECVIPRVKGKDSTAIEAIWRDLWTAT